MLSYVEALLADLSLDIYGCATQLLCQLMSMDYIFLNASPIY